MKSKFKKLMAAALVLCLMLALLPAGVLADGQYQVIFADANGNPKNSYDYGTVTATLVTSEAEENNSGNTFNGGDTVRITAKPNDNCGLVSLTIGEKPVDITDPENGASKDFVISANTVVKVAFRPYYNITTTADNCVVEVANKAMRYENVSFKVTPNRGYEVTDVKVGNDSITSQNGTYTFEMPNNEVNITVTTTERSDGHSITITTDNNGTVTVASPANTTTYYEGETIQLNVTPKEGYELESITGAEIGTGNTFTMPNDDVTVSATFKKVETPPPVVPDTYKVNVSSTTGGSAWADKSTDIEAGTWVTVYVQPSDGYYLKSLTVGGEDVTNKVTWDWYWNWYYSRTGTYSFLMPAKNVNVVATFDTWYDGDIACIYDGRFGNVSLNVWSQALDRFVPYTSASKGDLVQVIVEPYNGYAMNSLSISERNYWGSSVDYWQSWKHDNVYYFYMPDSDVDIHVDFTEAVSEHIVYVDKAANGLLKADTTWAADGQIVYVTATPDTGYVLSSLFVKTAKGDQLKVYEAKKAGVYYFYMPDQYVTVSAYFAPAASALPFNDVAYTSWYYDAVKFVYDKGIMDGVSYYRFAPDATITRGMVVTMLWRMAGEPYEAAAGFTDVAAGRYYTTAVAWAARNGIVEGMTATTFAPDQAITREQLASILYRYAKWLGFSGYGSDISGYTDAGKVSSYAYDAMSWAVRSGVVTGTSAKVLDPQGTASRAAAAQMFMNFYNYIK